MTHIVFIQVIEEGKELFKPVRFNSPELMSKYIRENKLHEKPEAFYATDLVQYFSGNKEALTDKK